MKDKIRLISILLIVAMFFSFTAMAADNLGTSQGDIPFADVSDKDWFYDYVAYAYRNELMQGTSETKFDPQGTATRAMVVTVLYRLYGNQEIGEMPFSDVAAGKWYYNAVAWAYKNNIVVGYPDGTFRPDENVTREQMVTFIYRYVAYCGGETLQRSNLNIFADRRLVSDYAEPAIKWAVAAGLLDGRSETMLAPSGETTRGELAAFLKKLIENVLERDSVMHPETANVPVLIFHSVTVEPEDTASIDVERFEAIIKMLYEAGYQTVSYQQLVDYVDQGTSLPEKPVIISLDDGYTDNLENAYPILLKYGFCCEISVIGCYVGMNEYDNYKIIPHFALEDVLEIEPGVVGIQSHTMRMHMLYDWEDLSQGRVGVAQRSSETDEEYYNALLADFTESYNLIADVLDAPLALTYPHGIYTLQSERAAEEVGYRITVSTKTGSNVLTVGNSESLKLLNRITVTGDTTAEEFEAMIQVN